MHRPIDPYLNNKPTTNIHTSDGYLYAVLIQLHEVKLSSHKAVHGRCMLLHRLQSATKSRMEFYQGRSWRNNEF